MRRTAVVLSTIGFSIFGFTGASFAVDAYPPQEPSPTSTSSVGQEPPPPATVTATVTVTVDPTTTTARCAGTDSRSGGGSGSDPACVAALPTTGSNSASTLQIGVSALIAGTGLAGVAGARRRKSLPTA